MVNPEYYPSTNILVNLLDLKDSKSLDRKEQLISSHRAYCLLENTDESGTLDAYIEYNLTHLKAIHRYLFQDIYSWSGCVRSYDMAKGIDIFFKKPVAPLSVPELRLLGHTIKDLLEFHYNNSNAELYFFVAESIKLKRFYDRLVKIYEKELYFNVRINLGDEDLGYEIKTPSYKS